MRHLTDLVEQLYQHVSRLQTDLARLETEWSETKDQIRKSYQRNERALSRLQEAQGRATPPDMTAPASEEPQNPHMAKVLQIRRESGAV